MYVLYMLISDILYPMLYNDWILFAVAFKCKCEQSEGAKVKKKICLFSSREEERTISVCTAPPLIRSAALNPSVFLLEDAAAAPHTVSVRAA